MAKAVFKRALLRCIKWGSESAGISLEAALKAAMLARYSESSKGRFLIGTSGNGTSVSFAVPTGLNPVDILETLEELYALYTLTEDADGGTPTDATVFATMLDELQEADSFFGDYTLLRTEGADA